MNAATRCGHKMYRQFSERAEPIGLIHGRAIGASHARLARRWVSRLHLPSPDLSALLTTNAPEVGLTAATAVAARARLAQHPAHQPLAESARLMPVTASPCPLRRAPQPA